MGGWGGLRSSLASASSCHSSVFSHSSCRSCGSSLRASLCSAHAQPSQRSPLPPRGSPSPNRSSLCKVRPKANDNHEKHWHRCAADLGDELGELVWVLEVDGTARSFPRPTPKVNRPPLRRSSAALSWPL